MKKSFNTRSWLLFLILCQILFFITNGQVIDKVMDFLQCNLCEVANPEGMVGDCQCNYTTVNDAVKGFYSPLLKNITDSSYFRYFKTDLEEECPHWYAENQCVMQKCSVDAMDPDELPKKWLSNVITDMSNGKGSNTDGTDTDSSGGSSGSHLSELHSDILEKEENDICK